MRNSLRGPITGPKKAPENLDPHAGNKYCNDSIARTWFLAADLDGSGGLDFEEFKNSALGKALTVEEARKVFESTDVDNNGQIDYDEFVGALKVPESPLARAALKAGMSSSNLDESLTFPQEPVKYFLSQRNIS